MRKRDILYSNISDTCPVRPIFPIATGFVFACHISVMFLLLSGVLQPHWYVVTPAYISIFLGMGTAVYTLFFQRRAEYLPTFICLSFCITLGIYGLLVPVAAWTGISISTASIFIISIQSVLLAISFYRMTRKSGKKWSFRLKMMKPGFIFGSIAVIGIVYIMSRDYTNAGADSNFYMAYIQRILLKGVINSSEIYSRGEGIITSYPYNVWLTLLAVPTYLFNWTMTDSWTQLATFTAPLSLLSLTALAREISFDRRFAFCIAFSIIAGHLIMGIKTASDYNYYIFTDAPLWDQSPFPRNLAWFVVLPGFLIALRMFSHHPNQRYATLAGCIAAGMFSLHLLGAINLLMALVALLPFIAYKAFKQDRSGSIVILIVMFIIFVSLRAAIQWWLFENMHSFNLFKANVAKIHYDNLYTFYGTFAKMPFTVISFCIGVIMTVTGGRVGSFLGPVMVVYGAVSCVDAIKGIVAKIFYAGIVGRIAISSTFIGWLLLGSVVYNAIGGRVAQMVRTKRQSITAVTACIIIVIVSLFYHEQIRQKLKEDMGNKGAYTEMAELETSFKKLRKWIKPRDIIISLNYRHPIMLASLGGFYIVPSTGFGLQSTTLSTEDVPARNRAIEAEFMRYNHFEDSSKINPSDDDLIYLNGLLKRWDISWVLTHPRWKLNKEFKKRQYLKLFKHIFEDDVVSLYKVI
jgi:hypothetical protein